MNRYLVISALGTDKPGIINDLSKLALDHHCNILDTRMTVLGGEFALLMMISGQTDAAKSVSDALPALSEKLGLTVISRQTTSKSLEENTVPCHISVVAIDNPGIVYEIARFFSAKHINIEEMHTGTYPAAHTGTPMFSLTIEVGIQKALLANGLEEEFISFCDEKNLDATIETPDT